MTTAQIGICTSIVVYLAAVLAIGIWCSKRNNSVDDFYLGGRKLGPFVTAMSAEASDMSSYLLMGLPGLAYLTGIADVGWTVVGLAVGTYLNWLIVAKRVRRYTHAVDAITLPDFFANRYGGKSRLLLAISALIIVIFFIPYTASGFAACGKLFASLFGIDYFTAMIISAVVIVGYTAAGGFLAASTTDFIQSIVMTGALLFILGFGVSAAGGWEAVTENARALPGYLSMTATHDAVSGGASAYGPITIVSTLAWGLGYFGMPHILLRFMAIEDDRKLKLSRRVASVWVVISMAVAVLIGVVGLAASAEGAIPFLEGSASETIIVQLSDLLSKNGFAAALVAGLVLAGILASTMSTADSQLLAAASSVSQNLISGVLGVKLSKKAGMLAARGTVLAISVIAVFLAWDPNSSVFGIVSFAWAGFGAAFGPVVLFALFWRRSNRWGALAGMVSGGAMVFIWKYLVRPLGGVWNIYELLPAFLVACVAIVAVSLLTAPPEAEITKTFDEVSAMRDSAERA
ncbi:MAG: sodium/proline symporter [Oscillospiraceae bacterium]|nr:sodium/proline symporter [Oscillospiraceae bacterium]